MACLPQQNREALYPQLPARCWTCQGSSVSLPLLSWCKPFSLSILPSSLPLCSQVVFSIPGTIDSPFQLRTLTCVWNSKSDSCHSFGSFYYCTWVGRIGQSKGTHCLCCEVKRWSLRKLINTANLYTEDTPTLSPLSWARTASTSQLTNTDWDLCTPHCAACYRGEYSVSSFRMDQEGSR